MSLDSPSQYLFASDIQFTAQGHDIFGADSTARLAQNTFGGKNPYIQN